jgi:spore germination protein GerM
VRRAALLVVAPAALVLAGCGIPTSPQAAVVPTKNVPFNLVSPTLPSAATTTTTPAPTEQEPIFLVRGSDAIVEVHRQVVQPADLGEVLDALLSGPTAAETSTGLSTALPASVRVVNTVVFNATATIMLNTAFTSISGPSQVLAVAQLVLTATSQPGITSVAFMVDGTFVPVPTASGASTTSPVTAVEYASLASP